MNNFEIAYKALRVYLMSAGASIQSTSDALDLLDVLYEPMRLAQEKIGLPLTGMSNTLTPTTSPSSSLAENNLVVPPATKRTPPEWLPVMHSKGPEACNLPAFYVTRRLHPRKQPPISVIRLVPTGNAPRKGLDPQICGGCGMTLDPFFSRDILDIDAVLMSPAQTYLEEAREQPDDPELLAKNRASTRWDVGFNGESAGEDTLGGLLRMGQAQTTAETVLLEATSDFSGLPPDSDIPSIDELPDPTQFEDFDSSPELYPDNPAR